MIRRTGAVLVLSAALALSGVTAQAASAHSVSGRKTSFCGDLKGMAASFNSSSSTATKKQYAKIDAVYGALQSKAPSKVKSDIKYIRGYLKIFAKLDPKKTTDYAKLSSKINYTKLSKATTNFSKWATPYVSKKCGIDINSTATTK